MLKLAQRDRILAILNAADDLTIATNRQDGYPQATTVSFVNDGLAIYFGTSTGSQKAQNLARDERVSVTVNLPYGNWGEISGVSIGGRARRITDSDELSRVGALMFRKFPQIPNYSGTIEGAELALFRIDAEYLSILDYAQGFGHTELVDMKTAAA